MSLPQSIAHYRITAKLGEGGMGEVWRATDTKLEREVAIKLLPETFAGDPDRLARFTREAQVLASLNHPNIAAIHGVEERALVMELVEGPTLADRIEQGPIRLDEALPIARQIAEALEYAHERGIIHRDLKPANVKISPEEKVKLLDFGLAKAIEEPAAPGGDSNNSPTLTLGATRMGIILGTAAYMSPEQAAGKPVDRRSDIWSFGAVLFEILSGRRAFEGESVSETLASVLKLDPDWNALPAGTPPAIRQLVRRCLTRDRRQRLQAIGEARILLEGAANGAPETPPSPGVPRSDARSLPWVIAAVAMLAAFVLAYLWLREPTSEQRLVRFSVPPPEGGAFITTSPPALSPDGRHLAVVASFKGQNTLWVRTLDSLTARQLPNTDGARLPFWSPDSRFIAFFTTGRLRKVDLSGGPPQTICDATNLARGGTWGKEGVILFSSAPTGGLFRVSASGGQPAPATEFDGAVDFSHRWPWFLPDGRHFLFGAGIVGSSLGEAYPSLKIYAAELGAKGRRPILTSNANAIYLPPGVLLFVRERTLLAQPFNAAKLETTGDAVPIAEPIDLASDQIFGHFSASQNGVLAYVTGGGGEQAQLTWLDRSGKVTGTLGPLDNWRWPAISPDGKSVAVDRLNPETGRRDVWTFNLERGTSSRFTFGQRSNQFPLWSPDGGRIVYESVQNDGGSDIYWKTLDGSTEEALERPKIRKRPADFSPDGRYVIEEVGGNSGKTAIDVWLLPLSAKREPTPFLDSVASERFPRVSPNGKWLAYDSDETKQREIYVQSFPLPGAKQQVSVGGGTYPLWSRNGKELFFIGPDDNLMAVDVKAGDRFEHGAPKPLFRVHLPSANRHFDVSRDGRFLMPVPTGPGDTTPVTIVLNWTEQLKK
jgi:serine/threonine protein kinase